VPNAPSFQSADSRIISNIETDESNTMTHHRRNRLYSLHILGAAAGLCIPLVACFTLFHVSTTGLMPAFATGELPLVLLGAGGALGCWVWFESAEIA